MDYFLLHSSVPEARGAPEYFSSKVFKQMQGIVALQLIVIRGGNVWTSQLRRIGHTKKHFDRVQKQSIVNKGAKTTKGLPQGGPGI